MTSEVVSKARLTMAITEAIRESSLRWPDYGVVIAGALSNLLGNHVSICVRADDGTALEFDGEGRYYGRVEPDEPPWTPL